MTDKDGIDLDEAKMNEKKVTFSAQLPRTESKTQIVVTKPMDETVLDRVDDSNLSQDEAHKEHKDSNSLSPSPSPEAADNISNSDEAAYALFEGNDDKQPPHQQPILGAPNSFQMEAGEDAEVIMVGIMRTLWFDRIQILLSKHKLDEIDDIFFILSNVYILPIYAMYKCTKQMN